MLGTLLGIYAVPPGASIGYAPGFIEATNGSGVEQIEPLRLDREKVTAESGQGAVEV
jgi:hypothetical protein